MKKCEPCPIAVPDNGCLCRSAICCLASLSPTYEDTEQRLGPAAGIGVFGLDALSSAAYGPEAALTLLIPLGALGIQYVVPISFSIIALLIIVYISYRQTISAYPGGGGSYTVARENLGPTSRAAGRRGV